jgi:hypothetical protein
MDVTMLASDLVKVLAPFLPLFLTQFGRETAERAGRQFGSEAWEHANAIWDKLSGRLDERPAARAVVVDTAEAPDDEDARAAFRRQLVKILNEDPELAGELRGMLDQRPAGEVSSVVVTAKGERSIAVGRDATASSFITGDRKPDPE